MSRRIGSTWKWIGLAAFALVGVAAGLVIAVKPWQSAESLTRSDLESVVDLSTQPAEVAELYGYVEGHEQMVARLPCYCGCGKSLGHRDLFDCYVVERGVYSDHATGCMVCQDEVRDLQRLAGDGRSLNEIRTWIDEQYSTYGAPTDTPPVKQKQ